MDYDTKKILGSLATGALLLMFAMSIMFTLYSLTKRSDTFWIENYRIRAESCYQEFKLDERSGLVYITIDYCGDSR